MRKHFLDNTLFCCAGGVLQGLGCCICRSALHVKQLLYIRDALQGMHGGAYYQYLNYFRISPQLHLNSC